LKERLRLKLKIREGRSEDRERFIKVITNQELRSDMGIERSGNNEIEKKNYITLGKTKIERARKEATNIVIRTKGKGRGKEGSLGEKQSRKVAGEARRYFSSR